MTAALMQAAWSRIICQACVEIGRRLAARLANFISCERALYDIGDRSMFAVRQIARLRTAHGELRFGRACLPLFTRSKNRKMARGGKMANRYGK
jgi:hypothetical protein